VTEPAERAEHRLTLGVGDLRLQDDVDDHPRHVANPTRRRPLDPDEICTLVAIRP
jgi:hypothetical protein